MGLGALRIVHCPDRHLGRRLPPLPLVDRRCLETYRHAGFLAPKSLVELCLAEQASLLVIAGDWVDAWDRNHQVGLRLVGELLRLEHSRTTVFWFRGNHDAESRIISTLRIWVESLWGQVEGDPPVTLRLDEMSEP